MSSFSNINMDDIIGSLNKQQTAANDANLARYAELLQSIQGLGAQVGSTFGSAQRQINRVGQAGLRQINQQGAQQGVHIARKRPAVA